MDESEYSTEESVIEYETSWYTGGYDRVSQPDGSTKKYYWADLPDAVTIVPITADGNLVFVEQYRPAAQNTFLGCPTGMVDEGESFEAAAIRELTEETGYTAEQTTHLTTVSIATGILRHDRGIVIADNVTQTEARDLDDNEFLSIQEVSPQAAIQGLYEPPVDDATVSAVLLAREQGRLTDV